jgi:hypothetical protein
MRQSNGAGWANNHRKIPMTKKFDPAPDDKHAADPKEAAKADKSKSKLQEGLEESLPGSDPASATQPKKP